VGKTVAQVWDLASGACSQSYEVSKRSSDGSMHSAQFNATCTMLLTAVDKFAKMWDVKSGMCLHTFQGHTALVMTAEFSRNETAFVTAAWDGTVKIWNVPDPVCVATTAPICMCTTMKVCSSSCGMVDFARFMDDGIHVCTHAEQKVQLWNSKNGTCSRIILDLNEQELFGVQNLTVTEDGSAMIIAFADDEYMEEGYEGLSGTLMVFRISGDACELMQTFKGHGYICRQDLSFDANIAITTSIGNTAKLLDVETGDVLQTWAHDGSVSCVVLG